MLYLLFFLLGGAVFAPIALLVSHHKHGKKRRADEAKYKNAWETSLDLMTQGGQLTKEQVASLRPVVKNSRPQRNTQNNPQRRLATWDRRDIEIARAKKGLPPADDLIGMATWDVKKVQEARIKFGTAE